MDQDIMKKWLTINFALMLMMAAAVVASLYMGSSSATVSQALSGDEAAREVIFLARLPRALLAALVGLALSSAGAAFQVLLRNPLADPFILGVSGGAALGSVVGVGLGLGFFLTQSTAFAGAVMAMLAIFAFSRRCGGGATGILLTGVIFNAFCFALILFVNSIVTMEEAYQIIFLLIGNLDESGMKVVGLVAIFVLTGFAGLVILSRRMNLLKLSDVESRSLGMDPDRLRLAVFFFASLMVGAAVAASGLIGFVGLFVPHAARLVFGSDERYVIPASGFIGAAFLVMADALARTVLSQTQFATELPVGAVTALVGAPAFLFLLMKKGRAVRV